MCSNVNYVLKCKHTQVYVLICKYTQEPWLYPPSPLTRECSLDVYGACTGTAQVSVSLVSVFDPLFAQFRLYCLEVRLT